MTQEELIVSEFLELGYDEYFKELLRYTDTLKEGDLLANYRRLFQGLKRHRRFIVDILKTVSVLGGGLSKEDIDSLRRIKDLLDELVNKKGKGIFKL